MSRVVLVSGDVAVALDVAITAGGGTHLVLLDQAAGATRADHPLGDRVRAALDAGVVIAVHDDAAARRGIAPAELAAGIKTVDLDEVADLVADAPGEVVWL